MKMNMCRRIETSCSLMRMATDNNKDFTDYNEE